MHLPNGNVSGGRRGLEGAVRTRRGRVCAVTGVSASRLHPGRTRRRPGGLQPGRQGQAGPRLLTSGRRVSEMWTHARGRSGVCVLMGDHPQGLCKEGHGGSPNDSTPRASAWQSAKQGPELKDAHRGRGPVHDTREGVCIAQLSFLLPQISKLARNCRVCPGVTEAESVLHSVGTPLVFSWRQFAPALSFRIVVL